AVCAVCSIAQLQDLALDYKQKCVTNFDIQTDVTLGRFSISLCFDLMTIRRNRSKNVIGSIFSTTTLEQLHKQTLSMHELITGVHLNQNKNHTLVENTAAFILNRMKCFRLDINLELAKLKLSSLEMQ